MAQEEVVSIDGKTVRRSHDRSRGKGHLPGQRLGFGQYHDVGPSQGGGEVQRGPAIPELLKLLALHGCIVTIDAMGCQREIAEQIVEGGADYVLTVKENQGQLYIEPISIRAYPKNR